MSTIAKPAPASAAANAVEVRDLRIALVSSGADVIDQIVLEVRAGEVLGLVGESGSGKTTVGMALMGYCRPGGHVTDGEVVIDGRDLAHLPVRELRRLRGGTVSYIPQDPGTALNPALRIDRQLSETLDAHAADTPPEARRARVRETLEEVALPSDDEFLRRYPHQLSGGQQQRVAIAMAFACRPHVIVCDEPTTGLDVTTQSRVLQTVRELCQSHQVAALYVSHDLAVVAELADHVAVSRGHVRRADRRARTPQRDLLKPPAPLHPPPVASRARSGRKAGRGRDPGTGAAPGATPDRMLLCPPLRPRHRALRREVPRPGRGRRRPRGSLPPRAGRAR